jgi:hypothetical protein
MSILSKNNNPKNESKYARHRSTWKGSKQQLRDLVEELKARCLVMDTNQRGNPVFPILVEVQGGWIEIREALTEQFNMKNSYFRLKPKYEFRHKLSPTRSWSVKTTSWTPPPSWLQLVAPDLKSDLALIWPDFVQVAGMRAPDEFWNTTSGSYDKYLLVAAISRHEIDIVFSKYGYDSGHHFFHWRARSTLDQGPYVDDLTA